MQKIFLLLILLSIISFNFYGNEKGVCLNYKPLFFNYKIQDKEMNQKEAISDMSFSFKFEKGTGTELFAKNAKKKISNYEKHLNIGVGLFVPGVILTVLSIPLMAAGIVLTLWSETTTEVVYDHWEYAPASVGGPTKVTKPVEVTTYPHQGVGIPLAATGGLFFVAGLPLLIVGAINLGKASKYRKKRAGIANSFALNLNYNLNDESLSFLLKYSF